MKDININKQGNNEENILESIERLATHNVQSGKSYEILGKLGSGKTQCILDITLGFVDRYENTVGYIIDGEGCMSYLLNNRIDIFKNRTEILEKLKREGTPLYVYDNNHVLSDIRNKEDSVNGILNLVLDITKTMSEMTGEDKKIIIAWDFCFSVDMEIFRETVRKIGELLNIACTFISTKGLSFKESERLQVPILIREVE